VESHLTFQDVKVDNRESPQFLKVCIKRSKTDPFRQGVSVFLGRTNGPLCPVAAILSYMVWRGHGAGPFFTFSDGRYLTRDRFVRAVRCALQRAGVDPTRYAGHSFRIGAAMTAAQRGCLNPSSRHWGIGTTYGVHTDTTGSCQGRWYRGPTRQDR
jgi:hypothetical protein